ncbi:MAG TPA: LysO family transporter [Candidatus Humimicrobiaceae bacterium]|nr:LysO family transporter [Candidatus Humimicrobiaceae bacterium]
MIDIILSLIGGIIIGCLIKLKESQKILLERSYTVVIFLLIFFMGLAVGLNKSIFQNLPKIGGYAILFSIFTIIGSIAGVIILEKTKITRLK